MTAKGHLIAALRQWVSTYSASAEVPIYQLSLDVEDTYPDLVALYETAASSLERLLHLDAVARGGFRIHSREAGDLLAVAGLRVRHLLREHRFAPTFAPERPRDAIRLVAALSRLLREIPTVLSDAATCIKESQEFRDMSWDVSVLSRDEADQLEQDLRVAADKIGAYLTAAEAALNILERDLIAKIPTTILAPSVDGSTLLYDFCVVCRPGKFPEVYQVRVFSPSTGPRFAIIGDLTDNSSSSALTQPAEVIDEIKKAIGRWLDGTEAWLLYLPHQYSTYAYKYTDDDSWRDLPVSSGGYMFEISSTPDAPRGTLAPMPLEVADDLIDGRFKRWHALNYTALMVIANGAMLVDLPSRESYERSVTRHRIKAEESDARLPRVAHVRCGRWFCSATYTVELDDLLNSRCPRCGGRKILPTERA